MQKSTQPYNKLPLLPPKINFTNTLFKKTIEANKALAELKGLAGLIPNQAIVLNSLILREAKDSSELKTLLQRRMPYTRHFQLIMNRLIQM